MNPQESEREEQPHARAHPGPIRSPSLPHPRPILAHPVPSRSVPGPRQSRRRRRPRAQAPSWGAPVRAALALPPASRAAAAAPVPFPPRDRRSRLQPPPSPGNGIGCSAGLRPQLSVGVAGASPCHPPGRTSEVPRVYGGSYHAVTVALKDRASLPRLDLPPPNLPLSKESTHKDIWAPKPSGFSRMLVPKYMCRS